MDKFKISENYTNTYSQYKVDFHPYKLNLGLLARMDKLM